MPRSPEDDPVVKELDGRDDPAATKTYSSPVSECVEYPGVLSSVRNVSTPLEHYEECGVHKVCIADTLQVVDQSPVLALSDP
ncbi:hypothetical protein MHYP_G00335180 [Metynnis hypsauchen]